MSSEDTMNRQTIVSLLTLLWALWALAGCGTIYGVAVDQRNIKDVTADQKIKRSIQTKFMNDDLVGVLDVTPYVYLGDVYLVGEYENDEARDRALEIAQNEEGAGRVTAYMKPKPDPDHDPCGTVDGVTVVAKVKKELIADKRIWSTNVDVTHVNCETVVLLGLVGSQEEIDMSIAHARGVEGVTEVQSFLRVYAPSAE